MGCDNRGIFACLGIRNNEYSINFAFLIRCGLKLGALGVWSRCFEGTISGQMKWGIQIGISFIRFIKLPSCWFSAISRGRSCHSI